MSKIVRIALEEDIGTGDVTSRACVPEGLRARGTFIAREPMVLAGTEVLDQMFDHVILLKHDGDRCVDGEALATVEGNARTLLERERVSLNFLQRLSGIATLARQYADAVAGTTCHVLDTRKTTPGMRLLEKHAAAAGGVTNHRMGLFDAILIKNNHIAAAGGVRAALARAGVEGGHARPLQGTAPHPGADIDATGAPHSVAHIDATGAPNPVAHIDATGAPHPGAHIDATDAPHSGAHIDATDATGAPHYAAASGWPNAPVAAGHARPAAIEIEVRTREELHEALDAGAEFLLLDNLTPGEAADWVREIAGRAKVELSGGITLETVRAYAETGADFVSVGAITHSARAADISFRLQLI